MNFTIQKIEAFLDLDNPSSPTNNYGIRVELSDNRLPNTPTVFVVTLSRPYSKFLAIVGAKELNSEIHEEAGIMAFFAAL